MRVFLDSNVWLSAVVFSGLCEEILLQASERGQLLSSRLVREECLEVLNRKFHGVPGLTALFDDNWRSAELVADVAEPADDADRRLVNAAAQAHADLFVTVDKRVLGWKRVALADHSMRIATPRDAWPLIAARGSG